jgi:hypothetical protein
MRELQITVQGADPRRVNVKVGDLLYVHLRAVPANVQSRRGALQRAHRLYCDAHADQEGRQGALGLLVLQRAMLSAEDLGALLHALEEPPSFSRLVSYRLDALGSVFARLNRERDAMPRAFLIPTTEVLGRERGFNEEQRAALGRLRATTLSHLRGQLAEVARFWEILSADAKKTMHGVGFLAGYHALEPPGAGSLSSHLPENLPRPFAVSLDTSIDRPNGTASTEIGVVDLTPPAVDKIAAAGASACDLTDLLASGYLHSLQTAHAFALPSTFLSDLEPDDQSVLSPLYAD